MQLPTVDNYIKRHKSRASAVLSCFYPYSVLKISDISEELEMSENEVSECLTKLENLGFVCWTYVEGAGQHKFWCLTRYWREE